MPDDIEAQRETFRQMGKTAFVLGYTGEVGKELVKELLKSKVFSKVTLIGRRVVNYEDELYKDIVSLHALFGIYLIKVILLSKEVGATATLKYRCYIFESPAVISPPPPVILRDFTGFYGSFGNPILILENIHPSSVRILCNIVGWGGG